MSEAATVEYLRGQLSGRPLTHSELLILSALADGMTPEQAAAHLSKSAKTINTQLKVIRDKLGAATRTQAVAIAIRRGMIG